MDSIIVGAAIFIAAWIAYPYESKLSTFSLVGSSLALLLFYYIFALLFNFYKKVWAYASVGELMVIVKSVTFSIIATAAVQFFISDFQIYKRALLLTWMVLILLIGGSRFIWRVFRDRYISSGVNQKRTLIIGAGAAGAMIARQLKVQNNSDLYPVGFIDDSRSMQKMQLYDMSVLGKMEDIAKVVKSYQIEHIIIAIPSLSHKRLNEVIRMCQETEVRTQILPKVEDLITGKVTVSQLKDVDVEDLLGREPVQLDNHMIKKDISGKTVLVTGAGGSIGSELCRQLIKYCPDRLILVGHGEYSIYSIDMDLQAASEELGVEVIPVIGDIRDSYRMFDIVETYRPAIIYHAAAHKHVPLMELNPNEAIKNNIIGTKNIAEAAVTFDVETFVLISTDKAVNPTSIMGATKRAAEMVIQSLNKQSDTIFTAVRFGNVLGSRGSVIPLFKKQIDQGGPVTITDPNMTRYFMTVPEASRLVIQAGALAKGGEIFVLDMGEPVKIIDLAKNLIKLSGYTEDDIPIQCIGARPGEKLYEELLSEDEILPGQVYEKIYVGRTTDVDDQALARFIEDFHEYSNDVLREKLMQLIDQKENIAHTEKQEH